MPYTRAWTNAVLGSNPANTIDTLLANIREDINERLTDLLTITSFTADPLVANGLKLNRAAATKILGGTTNLSIRNAADSADNILIDNATGNTVVRGTLAATGGLTGSGAGLTALNATNITSGTLSDVRIQTNPTFRGGVSFTNAAQINTTFLVRDNGIISTYDVASVVGAVAGDIVLPVAGAIMAAQTVGNPIVIFGHNVTNKRIFIGGGAVDVFPVIAYTTPGNPPPASSENGTILVQFDGVNDRLVYYGGAAGGPRYYLQGVAF
jgi:hypothetical protein